MVLISQLRETENKKKKKLNKKVYMTEFQVMISAMGEKKKKNQGRVQRIKRERTDF